MSVPRPALVLLFMLLAAATSCTSTGSRIRANPALFARLDPSTQRAIERGEVQPGWTPEMVELALGRPTNIQGGEAGRNEDATWVYHYPYRNERDYVRAGYRRRVVFDPVRRSDVITMEPVAPRLYPQLTPHSLRVTFRDGRVSAIERIDDL